MYKIIFTLLVFLNVACYAQNGSLKGVVSDSLDTAEPLIGAVISVVGNNSIGAVTEVDGSFLIEDVPAGTYSFKVSYLGYNDKIISNVEIKAGQITTLPTVSMSLEGEDLMVVTIVGTRVTNSEEAVIQEIKESEQVVSGISSEQISKSQDRDAAQVVARIPGVTVINDQFIMVRGLSQRYNGVMLNGLNAPSMEVDSRAFALDVIPSSMLDRMLVYKSGAPELPGDMTGSMVKIYTKTAVTENFTNVNATVGYRPGTSFTKRSSMTSYTSDAFGYGANSRAWPSSFPKNLSDESIDYNNTAKENAAKSLKNDWSSTMRNINPDMRFGFNIGRVKNIGTGSKKLSAILALTYSNTWQYTDRFVARNIYNYIPAKNEYEQVKVIEYNDEQLENKVRVGAIFNTSLILNGRNKIAFRNMYNQQGLSQTINRRGVDWYDNTDMVMRSLYYQQKSIYTGQLSGTHELKNDKTEFDWSLGYSSIKRTEPDFRRGGYTRTHGTTDAYKINPSSQATDNNGSRFNSSLAENSVGASLDIAHKLTPDNDKRKGITLKTGFFGDFRNRTFQSRWMSYVMGNSGSYDGTISSQTLEQIYGNSNIDATTGLVLNEGTDGSNKYTASSQLMAGYIGATIPVHKFIVSVGARIEHSIQNLDSKSQSDVPIKVSNPLTFVLPSLNVSYNITEKSLLRAAFAQTLNRPEFRELAPFGFVNFNGEKYIGNPALKTSTSNNYDLRYELYPSDNESFSVGGFYKDITNPIELYIENTGTTDPVYYFGNAPKASCYGLELEARKNLNFISSKSFFEKLSVLLNASVIKSEVKLQGTLTPGQASSRQLQGQSPYVVNAGFYYNDSESRLQCNIMYNLVGPRTFGVGNQSFATVYQVQRHVIDMTLTKGFGKHWELKGGVKDLLNQAYIMKEDSDRDLKNSDADKTVLQYRSGTYFTLGAAYNF